jgi:hypothetical protein
VPARLSRIPALGPVLRGCARGVYGLLHSVWCGASGDRVRVREVSDVDPRFDELWRAARNEFKVGFVRDAAYLNWRYVQHPLWRYKILIAEENGLLLGFMVLRVKDYEGRQKGHIVDFLARPDRLAPVTAALLRESLRWFRRQRVPSVSCWGLSHSPYLTVFRRHLFFRRHCELIMMTESWEEGVPTAVYTDPLNWHMTMGDDDAF